ncbi:MAG: hypothetical protein ACLVLH_03805 [Eisenbergiella massiliensis]
MSDRKYKRRRGKRRTKDTLLMVLPVILAVLAVAAAVFLILKFTTGGKKQETGMFTKASQMVRGSGEHGVRGKHSGKWPGRHGRNAGNSAGNGFRTGGGYGPGTAAQPAVAAEVGRWRIRRTLRSLRMLPDRGTERQ